MAKAASILIDFSIILGIALLPSIRGYSNWAIHEYLGFGAILACILYALQSKGGLPDQATL